MEREINNVIPSGAAAEESAVCFQHLRAVNPHPGRRKLIAGSFPHLALVRNDMK